MIGSGAHERAVDWSIAFLAMLIGGWIRWSGLRRQSLWIDEMSSYGLALPPLDRIASNILAVDAHPPGYIYLVHFFHSSLHLGIVGSVRGPSFLAGVLTIPVVYALARLLVGRMAAVLAAALAVLSPMLVWYSREGRMYAVTWLLVMLSLLCLVLAVRRLHLPPPQPSPQGGGREIGSAQGGGRDLPPPQPSLQGGGREIGSAQGGGRGSRLWLVGYALCVGASLYADISAIMAIVPQAVVIAIFLLRSGPHNRRFWIQVAGAYAAGWVLFVPWLLNISRQLALTHGTFAGYPPTLGTAWRLVLNLTGVEATYAFLFRPNVADGVAAMMLIACVAAIAGAVWLGAQHGVFTAVVLSLTLGTAAMCLGLVVAGAPSVLIPRVMGLTVFGIILALAGTAELAWRLARRPPFAVGGFAAAAAVALVVTGMSLATVEAHGYNGQNWRTAARILAAQAQPGDAVIYYPYGLRWMVDAYLPPGSPWPAAEVGIWQAPVAVAHSWFSQWAQGHAHVFFIFTAATGVDAPVQDAWFQSQGYRRVSGDPAAGYGVLEYVPYAVP